MTEHSLRIQDDDLSDEDELPPLEDNATQFLAYKEKERKKEAAAKETIPKLNKGFLDAPEPKPKPKKKTDNMTTLKGKGGGLAAKHNKEKDIPEYFKVDQSSPDMNINKVKNELVDALKPTQDTMGDIMKNPALMAGFDDPEVMEAVSEIAADAKKFEKYKNNAKVMKFYQAMAGMAGDKLSKKGEAQAEQEQYWANREAAKAQQQAATQQAMGGGPQILTQDPIGNDLRERAAPQQMQQQQMQQMQQQAAAQQAAEEDEDSDEEMAEIMRSMKSNPFTRRGAGAATSQPASKATSSKSKPSAPPKAAPSQVKDSKPDIPTITAKPSAPIISVHLDEAEKEDRSGKSQPQGILTKDVSDDGILKEVKSKKITSTAKTCSPAAEVGSESRQEKAPAIVQIPSSSAIPVDEDDLFELD